MPAKHDVVLMLGEIGFHMEAIGGIADYLGSKRDWSIRFLKRNQAPKGIPDMLGRMGAAGVIFHSHTEAELEALGRWPGVVVNVSTRFEPQLPTVSTDNGDIGRLAAEHFLERGHKHFLVGDCGTWFSVKRGEGFMKALAGHPYDDLHQVSLNRPIQAILRIIGQAPKPLAIFVPTDNHALELCMACSHAGIPIPESVAILGVDNHEATCCVGYPARSSVDIQARKIGWEAAGLMDHLLGGGAAPAEPILVEPSHVAVRRSTDVFAVGDPRIAQALKAIWTPGGERLDVPGLVKGTGLNRRTFERRFREATGSSPSVALRKARVECAKKMILDTHLGFPEIAERVGYATPEHFSQVFRSLTGCTPSAFRKQVAAARAGGDGAEEQGRSRDHVAK